MPRAGTAASPCDSIRNTNSTTRLEPDRAGSSVTPAKSGCRKRSIIVDENPARSSRSRPVVSVRRHRSSSEPRPTDRRNRSTLSLSAIEPTGAASVAIRSAGRRSGSPIRANPSSILTIAPGRRGRRSSVSKSNKRRASGYAVNRIWNPRSSRYPSTTSVRTLPPGPSLASSTITSRPARCNSIAAARPARPAPTTTTSAFTLITHLRLDSESPIQKPDPEIRSRSPIQKGEGTDHARLTRSSQPSLK